MAPRGGRIQAESVFVLKRFTPEAAQTDETGHVVDDEHRPGLRGLARLQTRAHLAVAEQHGRLAIDRVFHPLRPVRRIGLRKMDAGPGRIIPCRHKTVGKREVPRLRGIQPIGKPVPQRDRLGDAQRTGLHLHAARVGDRRDGQGEFAGPDFCQRKRCRTVTDRAGERGRDIAGADRQRHRLRAAVRDASADQRVGEHAERFGMSVEIQHAARQRHAAADLVAGVTGQNHTRAGLGTDHVLHGIGVSLAALGEREGAAAHMHAQACVLGAAAERQGAVAPFRHIGHTRNDTVDRH